MPIKVYRFLAFFICMGIFVPITVQPSLSEDGVSKTEIVFGQTAAFGGPASALGLGMKHGILAAFKEKNDQGGVHGRVLTVKHYDDGYEPDRAIENTHQLIDTDNVFALIGGVGTPTANAIQPIATKRKVPLIGSFTGAEFLRSPFKRYVVNMRGSYWQETEEWISYLADVKGLKRIAILYQDDSYGRAGLSGVVRALEKRDLRLVGEGTYQRNTTAVKAAVLSIRKTKPEAVVMVGAYKPCAEFIKVSKKIGFNPLFVNISFVGSEALSKELGDKRDGVIISQVVPSPFEKEPKAVVQKYSAALAAYDPEIKPGFVSLEGYMVGRLAITVLENIEGTPTRENFIDTLYTLNTVTIDDIALHYSENDNQGMDEVFMTKLRKDGTFLSIEVTEK